MKKRVPGYSSIQASSTEVTIDGQKYTTSSNPATGVEQRSPETMQEVINAILQAKNGKITVNQLNSALTEFIEAWEIVDIT